VALPKTASLSPGAIIPEQRLSSQALGILALIPKPNTKGQDGGTLNNYLASDSETFDSDGFDARLDGRLHERLNLFGRYSVADFRRIGPTAFGEGGGTGIRHAGRHVEVAKPQPGAGWRRDSLAFDGGGLPCRLLQVQGRCALRRLRDAPAPDIGIPGPEPRRAQLGAARRIHRRSGGILVWLWRRGQFCNCPLVQDEKQFQLVGNLTHQLGTHTLKFGADVRRAYNLRVASEPPRQGALFFSVNRTRGPDGGRSSGSPASCSAMSRPSHGRPARP
jgi:hypothetical protein